MGYKIKCYKCKKPTIAENIIDLIENKTDKTFGKNGGYFLCSHCGNRAYILEEHKLQEKNRTWDEFRKGVIRINTKSKTYHPYVYLISDSKRGKISGYHFNYYKDTRKEGGNLRHGHGPGGAPFLREKEFIYLIKGLISSNSLNTKLLREVIYFKKLK